MSWIPLALSTAAFTVHFQTTVIDQGHARVPSTFTGPNSLTPAAESAVSDTATLFLGARLRPGTELYVNPELAGGRGIGGATGLGGVANGETFRVGDPKPTLHTARLYLKQVFGLGGEREKVDDGADQVAATYDARRTTVIAGKFSLADWFDGNAYSHDPRSQFMNWALMDSAAWDYPADSLGYTWGVVGEYRDAGWAARAAAAAVPRSANAIDLDRRVGRAHGLVSEVEAKTSLGGRPGTARLLVYLNEARMGRYDAALAAPGVPDVTATRAYGRTKYGAALSADQQVADHLGAFTRLSWNDGRSETWAFTEVDASQAFGVEWTPASWGREQDRWGTAFVFNELSGPHRRYLAAAGSGFLLGDGSLHYGPEMILESYYRVPLREGLWVSPDGQLILNPGYDRARGPVWVWAVRLHAEL